MIAILGSNHDDILYFESVASNKRKDTILKKYEIITGTIYNQEVIIVSGINTSILSSAITSYLFSKYYIDLLIVVGRCYALSKKFKLGDIVISNQVINIDVDQIDNNQVLLGQIPSLPQIFEVQTDIISYLQDGLNKRSYMTAKEVTVISANDLSNANIARIAKEKTIFDVENTVLDSVSGGVAINSYLYGVPFISIKTVEMVLGEKWDVENYIKVLDTYINMDKAVVAAIGDIGRNDVIIGGTRS